MFYYPQILHFSCMETIIKGTFEVTEGSLDVTFCCNLTNCITQSLPPTPTPKITGGYLEPPLDPSNPILATRSIYKIYIRVCAVRTKDTMCYTSIAADTPASNPSLVSCRCCSEPIHTVAILWIAVRLTPYPSRN